ncbi:MAG: Ycf66 family protein [Rivularia sp. (in: cyanobacteria)]
MFYLAQVNIGTNPPSLVGLIQIIFGLFYVIFVIVQLTKIGNRLNSLTKTFYIIQLVIIPTFLLLSGIILVFRGWRLDPVLQFQQLILSLLVIFLSLKDILINAVNRNR